MTFASESALPSANASADLRLAGLLALVAVCGLVVNAGLRVAIRLLVRHAVRRAVNGHGRWRLRLPRIDDPPRVEQRRVQRADASAHMLARLASLVVGASTGFVGFRILNVDPVVLVSSAGFVGVAIALSGQTFIRDWLTGLLVLIEDRYAVGDQVTLAIGANIVDGTVETISGASVRLRLADGATWHAGHAVIESVTNRSQQLVPHHFEMPADVWAALDETLVGPKIGAASHDLGLTGVLLLADIAAETTDTGTVQVAYNATRALTERQQKLIEQKAKGQ